MNKLIIISIVAVLMMCSVIPRGEAFIVTCYETWSRCTGWSSGGTGWLWKSCPDRCEELGYNTGTCRLAPSDCPLARQAYQCQCED
uniref:Macin n=1 Tax=Ruditapes philippinarum TaxID=129788 RepID=A0A1P8SD50_RUDPH|nr:macin [Ruditapes philippinarum]